MAGPLIRTVVQRTLSTGSEWGGKLVVRPFEVLVFVYIMLRVNFRSYTTTGNVWSSDYCPTDELQVGQARVEFMLGCPVLPDSFLFHCNPKPNKKVRNPVGLSQN